MISKLVVSCFLLLLVALMALPVSAQDPSDDEVNMPPPPPNSDGPTTVKVGLYIFQITSLDQVNEEFSIEAFMDWQWVDERLVFDAEAFGSDREVFVNEEVEQMLKRNAIWWPELEITNERGSRDVEERAVTIFADGRVYYTEQFNATIQADFDLREFPFDNQEFHIRIESFIYDSTVIQLEPDTETIGFGDILGEEEWELRSIVPTVEDVPSVRSLEHRNFSEVTLTLDFHRHSLFYIYRILIPTLLIVAIFCASFLLGDYAKQLDITTIGVLTLVAFEFAIGDSLPHLAFLTFLDAILLISFILAAAAVVLNLVLIRFERKGQEQLAKKMNDGAIIVFPVAYTVAILLIWMIY